MGARPSGREPLRCDAVSRSPALVLAATLCAVVLAACSSTPAEPDGDEDTEALEQQVTELTEANADLAERLGSLEDDLSALRELPDDDPLSDVTASLSGLADRLDAIDARIDEEASARGEAEDAASQAASDLRSTLDSVRGDVETLQGEAEELRVLYETLRDRLDRLQSGG
ncbi:hypothetical protein FTX61_12350 [Nitriliruptoraceae bacterium ZYF776]|nr:hypothetical protein [Profundirhabdus halotolerans]